MVERVGGAIGLRTTTEPAGVLHWATGFVLSFRHRVRDFESWKAVFDDRLDARLNGKVTGHRLARSTSDPSEVVRLVVEALARPATRPVPSLQPAGFAMLQRYGLDMQPDTVPGLIERFGLWFTEDD
jgi:hypothetical protein